MNVKPTQFVAALLVSVGIAVPVKVLAFNPHGDVAPHHGSDQYPIEVLSGRSDAVTGGDALVRVTVKKNVALNEMRIKLNGADITSAFVANGAARPLSGPV